MSSRWFTLMSGGVSVPFAVAGIALGEGWAGSLSWTAGLLCFGLAAFLTWKAERERAAGLAARLEPKFDVGFEPDSDGLHMGAFREQVAPGAPEVSNRAARWLSPNRPRGHYGVTINLINASSLALQSKAILTLFTQSVAASAAVGLAEGIGGDSQGTSSSAAGMRFTRTGETLGAHPASRRRGRAALTASRPAWP